MPTVIDALVVTLGLDPKEYQKGRKDVAAGMKDLRESSAKTAKEMEAQGKRAAEFFSSVKVELLGVLAAVGALGASVGLKSFITSSVTGQAQLGRLSQNLNINARRLEAWGVVAKEMGGQATDAFNTLQTVASGITEASIKGHSAFTDTLARNGILLSQSTVQHHDYAGALEQISARMQHMPRQQAMWLANRLGIGSMFNELMLGPEELEKRLGGAEKNSRVSPQSIARAQALQKAWADVGEKMQGIRDLIFSKLEPLVAKLTGQFQRWLQSVDWDRVTGKLGALAQSLATWLGSLDWGSIKDQVVAMARAIYDWVSKIDWTKVGNGIKDFLSAAGKVTSALGGIKNILIGIAAIKVFGWVTGTLVKLRALTTALTAARAATAVGAAAAAGGIVGHEIWKHGLEGNKAGDKIGAAVAFFIAGLRIPGISDTAKEAWDRMHGRGPVNHSGDFRSPNGSKAPVSGSGRIVRTKTDALFTDLEKKNGLPSGLLSSVFSAESSRGKNLVSPKGALGPFQFMPGTAEDYGLQGKDVFNLDKSASAAARYLRDLIALFHGNVQDAVAAYNWGPGNVMNKGLSAMPQETRDYLRKVLGNTGAPALAAASRSGTNSTNTSTTQTSIGQITVNTKATDAPGIARDMRSAIQNNSLIAQVDTVLN